VPHSLSATNLGADSKPAQYVLLTSAGFTHSSNLFEPAVVNLVKTRCPRWKLLYFWRWRACKICNM